MTLDEIYPYWRGLHEELLETVETLSPAQLDAKPRPNSACIRELLVDFLHFERYWLSHLVGRNEYERPTSDRYPDGAALVEALTAARQVSARVLAPFGREGLRAVRHIPADPKTNRHETNMPIAWLIWQVLEREIAVWGQIRLRLEDQK